MEIEFASDREFENEEEENKLGEPYRAKLEKIAAQLELKGHVTIKLGGDEESQTLNREYRQKDYPTDVLSFPFDQELPEGGYYLGDIFISLPTAEKQAAENSIPLEQELLTLMVHGLLHLGGYDHETDQGDMMALQEKLLAK